MQNSLFKDENDNPIIHKFKKKKAVSMVCPVCKSLMLEMEMVMGCKVCKLKEKTAKLIEQLNTVTCLSIEERVFQYKDEVYFIREDSTGSTKYYFFETPYDTELDVIDAINTGRPDMKKIKGIIESGKKESNVLAAKLLGPKRKGFEMSEEKLKMFEEMKERFK